MKTIDAVNVYAGLDGMKMGKMEDKDKFALIKAMKALKPIKAAYEEFVSDAREKLKGEDFGRMQERAEAWRRKHGDRAELAGLTGAEMAELDEINRYFNEYNRTVGECVQEEAGKEVEPAFAKLTQEAFARLLASNPDLDMGKALLLSETLCG